MFCAILNLAYPKEHMFALRLTYVIHVIYNVIVLGFSIMFFVIYDYITITCDL